jgi:hypothetical protein
VRLGSAAAKQLQLDVCGEFLDALYVARKGGLPAETARNLMSAANPATHRQSRSGTP